MKVLLNFVFLFFASYAMADSDTIPDDRTIRQLIVYDSRVLVKFTPSFTNSQNCSSESNNTLQLDYDSQTGDNTGLLSTLLAAAAASKTVGFGIQDCAGKYPELYRVDVQY